MSGLMGLTATGFTYKFIAASAGVICNATFDRDNVDSVCPNRLSSPRKILVAALVAYEADTLQIALSEYDGIADILLSENLNLHNPRATESKPFYLWPRIRDKPQFSSFKSTIFWNPCDNMRSSSATFEAEDLDERCESQKIKELGSLFGYDVVISGSIDEIISRMQLIRLKWCKDIPPLPTKGAIGMPVGLLGRSFRTDWSPRGMPWAFSMPNIYGTADALDGTAKRNLARDRDKTPFVGGLHLTNYCFLPAMILKEMWTSDHGHNINRVGAWGSLTVAKQKCYDNFNNRIKPGTGPETVVPRLLQACPDSFPAWYGKVDKRERRFKTLLKLKYKV